MSWGTVIFDWKFFILGVHWKWLFNIVECSGGSQRLEQKLIFFRISNPIIISDYKQFPTDIWRHMTLKTWKSIKICGNSRHMTPNIGQDILFIGNVNEIANLTEISNVCISIFMPLWNTQQGWQVCFQCSSNLKNGIWLEICGKLLLKDLLSKRVKASFMYFLFSIPELFKTAFPYLKKINWQHFQLKVKKVHPGSYWCLKVNRSWFLAIKRGFWNCFLKWYWGKIDNLTDVEESSDTLKRIKHL